MKRMFTLLTRTCLLALLTVGITVFMGSNAHADHVCAVEDSDFATADGGCKDLATSLVWSSLNAELSETSTWYWSSANNGCADSNEGGFSDWRLASLNEFDAVRDNGALTHFNIGGLDRWFWSSKKQGNKAFVYNIALGESDKILATSATVFVCVRDTGGGNGGGGCMGKGC